MQCLHHLSNSPENIKNLQNSKTATTPKQCNSPKTTRARTIIIYNSFNWKSVLQSRFNDNNKEQPPVTPEMISHILTYDRNYD
ncbi:Hypothetical predicted protein [Octopus vulgaris]|uniref:Uncharacterized protein n=1 Tax=Octopus vulgaris TaxID=6645 RepID=A0AA36AWD5_OCTVU|nr:Hypothetical predicted protein [Octopus vulgaris]